MQADTFLAGFRSCYGSPLLVIIALCAMSANLAHSQEPREQTAQEKRIEELRRLRDEYLRREKAKKAETPAIPKTPILQNPASGLERGALAYLLADGWKRYACRVVQRDYKTMLMVSNGFETWITEAPIVFPAFCRECLGKGGFLSGPNEIITEDGRHHRLILPDWKEVR